MNIKQAIGRHLTEHIAAHGTWQQQMTQQKNRKYRFAAVRGRFVDVLRSLEQHNRVKFIFYRAGKRPIKGSGYLMDLCTGYEADNNRRIVVVKFGHLKLKGQVQQGTLYMPEGAMGLKNIRFIVKSLGELYFAIMKDPVLWDFFSNHFERNNIIEEDDTQTLTKFDIAVLD
jgi:hypothetical protein